MISHGQSDTITIGHKRDFLGKGKKGEVSVENKRRIREPWNTCYLNAQKFIHHKLIWKNKPINL